MSPRAALALAALLCSPGLAAGQAIRTGDHPGFSRVVFDLPAATAPEVQTGRDGVRIGLPGVGTLAPPQALPRLIASLRTGPDTAALTLAPGARAQVTRLDHRLVIDVRTPARIEEPNAATRPPTTRWDDIEATAREKAGLGRSTPMPVPKLDAPLPASANPAPEPAQPKADVAHAEAETPASGAAAPPSQSVPVVPVHAEHVADPIPVPPSTPAAATPAPFQVKVTAEGDVGAAAFRRGPFGIVVFDRKMQAPPPIAGAEWVLGPVSTVLQVALPAEQSLTLSHSASGWTVEATSTPVLAGTVQPATDSGATLLATSQPGKVVTAIDPVSGGLLLVGTSRSAGPGAAVADLHRAPSFTILSTWLGVAIEAASDQVDLRPTSQGFVLTGGDMPTIASSPGTWTRRFDIPTLATEGLLNRLRAQLASAANGPPRARSADRVGAARTMLALGMGAEAQGLLLATMAEDPRAAADAEVSGLTAVAAVLAGRAAEAGALDDARLDGTDEVNLWRGLRDQRRNLDTPAARGLGHVAALATTFPSPLRDEIWPELAEAAVQSGNDLPKDLTPPLAQAMLLEHQHKVGEALVAYDAVAAGPDRIVGPRAAVQAIELRLSSGQIGAAEAADAMDRRSYDWRGGDREATVLLRAAELRAAARDWHRSLDALRSVDRQFPDRHPAVIALEAATIEAMLEAKGGDMSALDVVLLAAENAGAVPDGPAGAAMARLLADKLMALDLPSRAIPVLQGLVSTAPAGPARAEFGARLAQLLLEGDSPADAATALQASSAGNLPAPLEESRTLLLARAKAGQGDLAGGTALLRDLATDPADDLRATLLERAGDLRGSLGALNDLAARHPLPDGPLPDATQDVLLRQASLAARIQDRAALHGLAGVAPRLTGPRADLFRTLTLDPIGTPRDLTRAGRELALARGVPERLQAWQGR